MRTTSSIAAPHREHASVPARLLLDRFDTISAPCVRELRFSIVANARSAGWLRDHDKRLVPQANRWTPPFRDRVGKLRGKETALATALP
jgi:hypothetical protein